MGYLLRCTKTLDGDCAMHYIDTVGLGPADARLPWLTDARPPKEKNDDFEF
jgi:hypothetical protein